MAMLNNQKVYKITYDINFLSHQKQIKITSHIFFYFKNRKPEESPNFDPRPRCVCLFQDVGDLRLPRGEGFAAQTHQLLARKCHEGRHERKVNNGGYI